MLLTLTSAPPFNGSLLNLSTRVAVGTGNDVLIGGFIVTGGAKQFSFVPSVRRSRRLGLRTHLADPFLKFVLGMGG